MLSILFGKPHKNIHAQQRIEMAISGFAQARKIRAQDAGLLQEFHALQAWQAQRLMVQYDTLFSCDRTRAAAQFMLQEVYSGDQLALISNEILRTAKKAWKLVPGDMVDAAASAIEANVLTVTLDEAIARSTRQLGGIGAGSSVYIEALSGPELIEGRRQQLLQFEKVASSIVSYLEGNSIHLGLRMTTRLARKAGVVNLHGFLTRACRVLRDAQNVDTLINCITKTELHLLDQVEKNTNPFQFMDVGMPRIV